MSDQHPSPGSIVVTGGGSGIGAATCRRLCSDGYRVVVLDRRQDAAEEVAEQVDGVAVVADVADASAVEAAFGAIGDLAGGELAGLVNNAGIGNLKRLEDYSPDEVDLIWRVNFGGTYNCLRSAAPLLRNWESGERGGAEQGGAVVNVASVSGVRPTRGEAPYSAAKAAVIALTSAAALEWAPRVRVNCVSPGFIRTPLNEVLAADESTRVGIEERTPASRLGTADEVAALVSVLLSAESGYLTGQNIVLDGGSMLSSAQMDAVLGPLLGD